MAGALQRFERRLEGAVTGAFARAFRSNVQPVEIVSALQREIDNSTNVLSRGRTLVPNNFTVELSPADFERLTPFGNTLADDLADQVKDHVTEQRYTLAGPLEITFQRDEELRTGRFRIRSIANASIRPSANERLTDTGVRAASVILEVGGIRHPVTPPGLIIGRGSDTDLRIDDPGISRRHVEILVDTSQGEPIATISDLGSTNGTLVDGRRIDRAPLGHGSQVRLGNTIITVRLNRES